MFEHNDAFSGFSVDDTDAARRFYGETLGLSVSMNEMGILEITLASGARVICYPKSDHTPATFTILNFLVPDIDAAVDGLVAAGVEMERYPAGEYMKQDEKGISRGGGPAIAWFNDPAGNILSVIESPAAS